MQGCAGAQALDFAAAADLLSRWRNRNSLVVVTCIADQVEAQLLSVDHAPGASLVIRTKDEVITVGGAPEDGVWRTHANEIEFHAGVQGGTVSIGQPRLWERTWSHDEDDVLHQAFGKHSYQYIAELLEGRTPIACMRRAHRLGLLSRRYWEPRELKQLAACADTREMAVLAQRLGRTPDAVRMKATKLRLPFTNRKRPWSKQEDRIVRREYNRTPIDQLAAKINRTRSSVRFRAKVLGVLGQN